MVRAGVIPKTGISSPYVTACAAESEATIATMKKLFPNFDYLGGVRAQKAKEKAEELERAKWAKINEENQRKCSQLVASYLDQCATAGNVENCVTIKSKGNIYYAPGPFSLGWNCR